MDCQLRGQGFKFPKGQKLVLRFMLYLCLLEKSVIMSAPTVPCWWEEDEMVKERTGHPPSFAEAKKMKLITFILITASGLA